MLKIDRILQSPQVLNALIAAVRPYLPLDLRNTALTAEDIIAVLGYASGNRISMDAACQELKEAPSANRLHEVLAIALPDRTVLQRALNRILRSQTPRFVKKGKGSYYIAIDLTLIPYHGEEYEDEKEILRGEAKSGTTHFHGYATVSIVHNNQRYVLALRFVEKGESMETIVAWLLKRLKSMGISIRCAYLDKGFCSVPVLKTLQRRKLRFILPIPVRGKSGGVRTLFHAASRKTTYTLNSPKHGVLEVHAVVVKKYSKGRFKRKGTRWFAYAVGRLSKSIEAYQVFEMYRQRFGIETSYRQMNQVRARTTSRNPVVRLLLVGLAFIIFNLYITHRERIAICLKNPAAPVSKYWLTLRRLVRMIAHAVEKLFDLADAVFVTHASHFRDLLIMNLKAKSTTELSDSALGLRSIKPLAWSFGEKQAVILETQTGKIYTVSLDKKSVKELEIPHIFDFSTITDIDYSPDRKQLAYTEYHNPTPPLSTKSSFVFDFETKLIIPLVDNDTATCDEPKWSPNGKRVLLYCDLSTDGISENNHIYILDVIGNAPVTIKEIADLPCGRSPGAKFAWSPDGNQFVAAYCRMKNDPISLFLFNSNGGIDKKFSPQGGLDSSIYISEISWSPDGQKILYIAGKDENSLNIYMMDIDGSNNHTITANPSNYSEMSVYSIEP